MSPDPFRAFAARIVQRHEDHLLDYGPDEQTDLAAHALARFHQTTPLIPTDGTVVDLAGFGRAPVHFEAAGDRYLLASDVSDALGWPLHQVHEWVDREHGHAVRDQRHADEKRGDGLLGHNLLRGYVDLGLSLIVDDPQAKPDAGGRRWSFAGDWLVSHDRIPALLMESPWGREFTDNSMDAFAHAARRFFPGSGLDLFRTDLDEEAALRKARRGPVLDDGGADQ